MSKRPHLSKSLVELTAIVDKSGVSSEILDEVVFELKHRKSAGAKKLLKRISSSSRNLKPNRSASGKGSIVAGGGSNVSDVTSEETFTPATTPDVGPEAWDVAERLRALRETYTEGAELLARWGATTALPKAILEMLFEQWAILVSDVPDEYGRSHATLQLDLQRWKVLKTGILSESDND